MQEDNYLENFQHMRTTWIELSDSSLNDSIISDGHIIISTNAIHIPHADEVHKLSPKETIPTVNYLSLSKTCIALTKKLGSFSQQSLQASCRNCQYKKTPNLWWAASL